VSGQLERLDRAALRLLRTRFRSPALERAAITYTATGEFGALWIGLSLGGALLEPERRRLWLACGAVVPLSLTVNYVVKRAVHRHRPQLPGVPPSGRVPTSLSFPSGHAATSFAGAEAIGTLVPRARRPLRLAAGVMALTRPYLGLHYPSDALAGSLLGAAVGRSVLGRMAAPRA
jgi:membrane-associated phospholipid phosphatase